MVVSGSTGRPVPTISPQLLRLASVIGGPTLISSPGLNPALCSRPDKSSLLPSSPPTSYLTAQRFNCRLCKWKSLPERQIEARVTAESGAFAIFFHTKYLAFH